MVIYMIDLLHYLIGLIIVFGILWTLIKIHHYFAHKHVIDDKVIEDYKALL